MLFLANRTNIQARKLHKRLRNQLSSGGYFDTVQLERGPARAASPYRIYAETDPRVFLDDISYPENEGRLEVGFDINTSTPYEHYRLNWIEPNRNIMVGWHQDHDHDDLGEVHAQLNDGDTVVEHVSATFIDSHPLDVFEKRMETLPDLIKSIEWESGRPVGLNWP